MVLSKMRRILKYFGKKITDEICDYKEIAVHGD
jgi:hypothetical protein